MCHCDERVNDYINLKDSKQRGEGERSREGNRNRNRKEPEPERYKKKSIEKNEGIENERWEERE